MILPKDIKTRNKIRDAKIIYEYMQNSRKQADIGKEFGLTEARIGQILAKHVDIMNYDVKFEKIKRINRLKRALESLPETISNKKDFMDVQAELRKEIEGDKSQSEESKTIVNVYIPDRQPIQNSNRLATPSRTPGDISSE